jgi:dienelactone hydrolase
MKLKTTVVVCLAFLLVIPTLLAQTSAPSLKDEMRMLWTRNNERYIRHWLVVGAFEPAAGAKALEIDFLTENGGESEIKPSNGLAHKRQDAPPAKWHPVDSWGDAFGIMDGLDQRQDGAAAYGFATIKRAAAGKAVLSLGSEAPVRAWVNGKLVIDRDVDRSLTFDEDTAEIDLNSGENALLVKVVQLAGRAAFSARVLESGSVLARSKGEIGPSINGSTPSELTVKTDVGTPHPDLKPVTVELVAPGGKILFTKTVPRSDTVTIPAGALADGPYEVRCTTRTLAGRLYATHLVWYKGDALVAARELLTAAAAADSAKPDGITLKMLADMVEDRLEGKPDQVKGNPWWKIHSPLMEFAELKLEAAGQTAARIRPYGFYRLAYRDEVDGSPQFCRSYLPAAYDPAKKWPLVLQIHGYNPANPKYVRWWAADSRHAGIDAEFANHQGVIYMEPHGRGNTTYLGLGDTDILTVIALAKKHFNVDEDRVYLTGDSMGGWGTWNVATRHPDLFAAIAPVYGGADYHSQLPEAELAKLSDLDRFFLDKHSSWSMADGLLNMPIFVHHGDVDKTVSVDYSRYGVRMLERWGYDVRYQEVPGRGHESLDVMNDNIEWFLKHRRNPDPVHVRIRSAELRNASAYWARVEQAASPLEFMALDAEVVDPNTIRLDTQNVAAVTLSLSKALVDPAKSLKIIWNGNVREANLKDGRVRIVAEKAANQNALSKSPALPGTISDFTTTPFAIVVGTVSKDPEMVEMCREKADAAIKYWRDWQKQEPRVFKDTELTDSEAARYSLLLFGGPEANAVTAKLAGRLPIRIAADEIAVDGKSFRVTNAAVQMLYPNPLNPARYVLLDAGSSVDGLYMCDPLNRDLGDWDFAILDGRYPPQAQRVPQYKSRVVSGVFDASWRLNDSLLVRGDEEIRSKTNPIRRPRPDPNIDSKVFAAYAGQYQIPNGPIITVTLDGSKLTVAVPNQSPVDLIPESETTFFVREINARLVFVRDPSGKITGVNSTEGDVQFNAAKVQ